MKLSIILTFIILIGFVSLTLVLDSQSKKAINTIRKTRQENTRISSILQGQRDLAQFAPDIPKLKEALPSKPEAVAYIETLAQKNGVTITSTPLDLEDPTHPPSRSPLSAYPLSVVAKATTAQAIQNFLTDLETGQKVINVDQVLITTPLDAPQTTEAKLEATPYIYETN